MNTNNNIKTCCEKCYIYGSYADIRCYNLKCPCHSDTSEKERCCIYCGITYVGKECPKGCKGYTPLIQSSVEVRVKDLRVILDYVERWNKQDKEVEVAIAQFNLENLLETEHKKWIENK